MGCCGSRVEIASKLKPQREVDMISTRKKERALGKQGESIYSSERFLDYNRNESKDLYKDMDMACNFLSRSSVSEKEKILEYLISESSISYDYALTFIDKLFKSSSEPLQDQESEDSPFYKSCLSSAYSSLGSRITSELFQKASSVPRSEFIAKLASSSLLSSESIRKTALESSSTENKTPRYSVQNPKSRLLKSKLDILPYHNSARSNNKRYLNFNEAVSVKVKVKVDGCPKEILLGPHDDPVKTAHLFSVKNRFDMRQRNSLVKKLKSIYDNKYD